MANRNFSSDMRTMERGLVALDFTIAIGATGAPTLTKTGSTGIASVARTAAGTYTITLEDSYLSLVAMGLTVATVLNTYSQGGASINGTPANQDVVTNKQVTFYTYTTGAAAADLPSGCTVHVNLLLKNSQY